jgi:filamentous hemagglutinin family protein
LGWKLGLTGWLVVGGAFGAAMLQTLTFWCNCALAQSNIVPDNTLGAQSSVVTPNVDINGIPSDRISGGAIRGANLFHSFQEFNIDEGRGAYFTNPAGIENILSRVTGGNASNILGKLGVLGNANLFLINPNGIIFGQNASLDVRGSFLGTTANAIGLSNKDIFNANPLEPLPSGLLNVNPNAFFFSQIAAEPSINRSIVSSAGLQVPPGQSLLLVGRDVSLEGGQILAPGGRIELAGVGGTGTIGLSVNGSYLGLNLPGGVQRADVSLSNGAVVNVIAGGGGSIAINARNLDISGESGFYAGIGAGLGSIGSKAGNIEINATDKVKIDGSSSGVASIVGPSGIGNGADINIQTGTLSLTNGAQLIAVTSGQGNAGNIQLNASDSVTGNGGSVLNTTTVGQGNAGNVTIQAGGKVSFDGVGANGIFGGASSIVAPGAVGNGGNINIQAGSLFLTNGANLNALTVGQGNAGSIQINASDSVTGNGGSVLEAGTGGQGNAGNVTIQAGGKVSFDGIGANNVHSGASSIVAPGAVGNGGNINIQAGSLFLTNGANLSPAAAGQGNAGNVTIKTDGTVSFDGAGILNASLPYASGVIASVIGTGKGGDITITGGSLSVTNGAQLNTLTLGQGNAGNVTIKTDGLVSFDGTLVKDGISFPSGVVTAVGGRLNSSVIGEVFPAPDKLLGVIPPQGFLATGNGGNIKITAGSLSLKNGAIFASTSNFGQGNAGNISVQVNDFVSLAGAGTVIASNVEAGGVGKGGNIDIQSRSLSATGGAVLNTGTRGQGNAGNILVNARDEVELSGVAPFPVLKNGDPGGFSSGLLTNSNKGASGQGGEISVNTGTLRVSDGAVLSARSQSAKRSGNITVNANVLEVTGGGQFLTTAYNSGDAGNITVNVKDRITISGTDPTFNERFKQVADAFPNADEVAQFAIDPVSPTSGFFANTSPGSTGNGGSIFIDPIKLTITDGAGIAVNSLGKGNAGSLQVQAGSVTLDGRAFLSATTASTEGGNIHLRVQDLLLMRRGSEISTNAGTTGAAGNGGNITINAPDGFIVASKSENSDITANAFTGSGGKVQINATSIFGLTPRSREDLVSLLGTNDPAQIDPQKLTTSDITAISQTSPTLNGTVTVNTPDVDPNRGLVNLPAVPLETEVSQVCQPRTAENQSSFTIIGRGGLPPNPRTEPLSGDAVQVDWVTLKPRTQNRSSPEVTTNPTPATPAAIVEAQGWVRNAKGEVVLTANVPTATPHNSWQTPAFCHGD